MLWWNGKSLKRFWTKYDLKVFEATSYEKYHLIDVVLQLAELDRIKAY
jgi:hypothetical protein